MGTAIHRKLCWNCEEEVSVQVENCPYCGSCLNIPLHNHDHEDEHEEYSNYSSSSKIHFSPDGKNRIPIDPYLKTSSTVIHEDSLNQADNMGDDEHQVVDPLYVLVFLLPGSMLLFFGILIAVFSREGKLVLEWNAQYWIAYTSLGGLLSYFGWRQWLKMSDDRNE